MEDLKVSIYRKILVFCLFVCIYSSRSLAQEMIPSYSISEQVIEFSEIEGSVLFRRGEENQLYEIPSLSFEFTFDGTAYSRVSVHPQGWIVLGDDPSTLDGNNLTNLRNPILAVLWDEFNTNPEDELLSEISYLETEENSIKVLIIQWKEMQWSNEAAEFEQGSSISFQAKLYEDGHVEYLYHLNRSDMLFTLDPSAGIVEHNLGASIGLGGVEYSSFNNVLPFSSGLEESSLIRFETSLHNKALVFTPNVEEQAVLDYFIFQNTGSVRPSEIGKEILKVKINISSHYNGKVVNSFFFNTNGSTNTYDIKNARLFYTGSSDVLTFSNQYGTTVIDPNGAISFASTSITLSTGDNYFWLCYDISNTANEGNVLDARLTAFYITEVGNYTSIPSGNPTGSRLILEATGSRDPNIPSISAIDYNLNWEEVRTFDENGNLLSQERTYLDGIGRAIQVQSKIGNQVTAKATVYDAFGRPVISTLPSPLPLQTNLQFASNFISLPNGSPYSYNDFDISSKLNNPNPLGKANGSLGWYYSNLNNIEPYVPADSYPYSRVQYSDDPSAQLKRKSMAGENHKFGSGHETQYYNMSSGGELAYVYGYHKSYIKNTEGNYANVAELLKLKKSIMVDSDGKTNVIFTNGSGNTIATCRSGIANNCTAQKISQTIKHFGTKSIDIHLPKSKNNTLKFNFPSWFASNANYITLTITDLKKSEIISNNSSNGPNYYTIESNGQVVFYGSYANQDNYLRISCVLPDRFSSSQTFSYPNIDIPIVYELDYSHWTLNYYDIKGNLVEEVSPKAIDCTFNPLALNTNSTRESGTFSSKPLWPPYQNTASIEIDEATNNELRFLSVDVFSVPPIPINEGGDPQRPNSSEGINVVAMEEDNTGGTVWSYTPTDPADLSRHVVHRYLGKIMATSINGDVKLFDSLFIYLNMSFYENGNISGVGSRVLKYFDHDDLKDLQGEDYTNIRFEIEEHLISIENIESGYKTSGFVAYDDNNSEHSQDLELFSIQYSFNIKYLQMADAVNHNITQLNTYNKLNRLVKNSSPDEGIMEFVYDDDGKLRFTQNSEQMPSGRFSYINYDKVGRVIETGEYNPNLPGDPEISPSYYYFFETAEEYTPVSYYDKISIINVVNNTGYLSNYRCTQRMFSAYDKKATDFPVSSSLNTQSNLQGRLSKTWNEHSSTWYSYDLEGKLIDVVKGITMMSGYKNFHYTYDYLGNVIKSEYQKAVPAERMDHSYTYNIQNSLEYVSTSRDGNPVQHAKYIYYKHGPLKRIELGGSEKTQGLDYVYTINGWLKSINDPTLSNRDPGGDSFTAINTSFAKDVFGMNLHYFSGDYKRENTFIQFKITYPSTAMQMENKYNGLTMGTRWQTTLPSGVSNNYSNQILAYNYLYTEHNELKEAVFATATAGDGNRPPNAPTADDISVLTSLPEYRMNNITYDLNGNLISLKRDGNNVGASVNPYKMDELQYNYSATPNRLTSVSDAVGSTVRAEDIDGGSFTYDAIGRMIIDGTRGAKYSYDIYGKVTEVRDATSNELKIKYTYDDAGFKLSRTIFSGGVEVIMDYYVNDATGTIAAIYDKDNNGTTRLIEQPIYGAGRLGTYYAITNKYVYEISDHQGNIRVVIGRQKQGVQAEVLAYIDYDALGNVLPGRVYYADNYRFGYQGQEINNIVSWNEFEARMYDPGLGRWLVPDPAAQFHSPYLAMGNVFTVGQDPDGRWFGLDDAIVSGVGFLFGYVSHGISTGDWGKGALINGGISAATSWLGYNTFGASLGATKFISNMAINHSLGFLPSMNIPIGNNTNISLSLGGGFGMNGFGIGPRLGISHQFELGGGNYLTLGLDLGATSYSNGTTINSMGGGIEFGNNNYGIGIYSTSFKGSDNSSQRVGGVSIRSGKFSLRYENDWFFGLPTGDNGDRYRTAAAMVAWGDFSVGVNLFTGAPNERKNGLNSIERETESGWVSTNELTNKMCYIENTQPRLGAAYIGFKNYKVGINHENVRYFIQNKVIHQYVAKSSPYFNYIQYNSSSIYLNTFKRSRYTLW